MIKILTLMYLLSVTNGLIRIWQTFCVDVYYYYFELDSFRDYFWLKLCYAVPFIAVA